MRILLLGLLSCASVVRYGSHISLTHVQSDHLLNSLTKIQWAHGGQIVTGVSKEPDTEVVSSAIWIVRAPVKNSSTLSAKKLPYFTTQSGIPKDSSDVFAAKPAGTPVRCGDEVKMEHAESGLILSVLDQKSQITRGLEVVGLTPEERDDTFIVDCAQDHWDTKAPVKFRLNGVYLSSDSKAIHNCVRCPMRGQAEVSMQGHNEQRSSWNTSHILEINNSMSDGIMDEDEDDAGHRDEL